MGLFACVNGAVLWHAGPTPKKNTISNSVSGHHSVEYVTVVYRYHISMSVDM